MITKTTIASAANGRRTQKTHDLMQLSVGSANMAKMGLRVSTIFILLQASIGL
jgi:hypothetical protein